MICTSFITAVSYDLVCRFNCVIF